MMFHSIFIYLFIFKFAPTFVKAAGAIKCY